MPSMTRLSGLGVAALSLFSTVSAAKHGAAGHEKRQNSAAITGASGSTQPRLEIRQLEQDADQWNLFMLAMQAFQNTNHNDVMSWYQLAGIHGMPYEAWNGVQGSNAGTGYCPHSSPLFICWHRPYVAAWEQAMLANAQTVVNSFSGADKTRYQNALQTLRHPYWDWAEVPPSGNSADCMPQSMSNKTVTVNTPTGQKEIPNPLYSFNNMNPHDQSDFSGVGGGDWDAWGSTLRYPSSANADATSDEASAVSNLGGNNAQARAQVYRVLTACPNFLDVSNDGVAEQNQGCGVSLESIHNGIHTFTGGVNQPGHMTYNNFAAFDAAFFLHHANVDRLFAMWQAINPNSYMTSASQGSGATFTINANQQVDGNTPLEPFHNANGQAYTCNSIRDIETFHYTYPEIQAGNVAQAVNNLYGSNAVPQKLSSVSSSASSSATSSASSSASSKASSAPSSNSASATGSASRSGASSGSASGSATASGKGSSSGSASGSRASAGGSGTGSATSTPAGSSGASSAAGSSGASSAAGSSGASSVAGSSGAPAGSSAAGSSGASGASSAAASSGASGASSAAGAPGASGVSSGASDAPSGAAGSSGSVGAPNVSGSAGASGVGMSAGISGIGGISAGVGPSGISGGVSGPSGASGAASSAGVTSAPAASGTGAGMVGAPGSIIGGQQVSNGATTAPSAGLTFTPGSSATASSKGATGTGSFPQLGGSGGLNSTVSNSSAPANLPSLLTPTGRTHDYTCHVVSEKHGLAGTYTIFGFLGNDIPDDANAWLDHPDFCGAHSVFAPLGVQANNMLVGGQISLTTALVGKIASGDLNSLEESDVLPYLAKNLNWKVSTAQGVVVPNDQVPGLTVGAVAQKVMPAANQDSLPTYGQGQVCQNATHGKAGGVQTGMQYDWWNVCGAQPASSKF